MMNRWLGLCLMLGALSSQAQVKDAARVAGYRAGSESIAPTLRLAPAIAVASGSTPINDNTFYVEQAFLDLFARVGDSAGVAGWVSQLNANQVDRYNLVLDFLASAEGQNHAFFVTKTYLGLMLRDPDITGWDDWMSALSNGTTQDQVVQQFLTSAEFQSHYGASTTNTQFVTLLYLNMLHRGPDAAGLQSWLAALTSGQSRSQVAIGFITSPEFDSYVHAESFVDILYLALLRRASAPNGRSYWLGNYASFGPHGIVQDFIALAEYQARFMSLAQPVGSPNGGTFTTPQTVTLTSSSPGVSIYYTLDGTVPNITSPSVHSGGTVAVAASSVLTAVALNGGVNSSPLYLASFSINSAPVGPTITVQPTPNSVQAGQSATFSVTASGTGPLSYQWSVNGGAIAGARSSSYTTPPQTSSQNGNTYQVAVSNVVKSVNSAAAKLTVNATLGAPALIVNASTGRHPINPDVYGIANYGLDANFAKEIQVPNIRWGGDGTTRYNWLVDSSNAGFDWFFMGGNGVASPVAGASVDAMVNTFKPAGSRALITIPIIPYVNKLSAWNCSFPYSIYGQQQSSNPYVHPNGDTCGNSIRPNSTQLIDSDIYANHIDNTAQLQQSWVQHLVTKFGIAANGGVPYYQLDNEPSGWGNTHRDVEPGNTTYDTIIMLGKQYAGAIKAADSSAKVFGPSDFTLGGWLGNQQAQGGLYAGQYYLKAMADYEQTHGERILDYFDEHYYAGGTDTASELASTRSLWDPTFNSGTWLEQYFTGNLQMIPRLKDWINTYYPGTLLAVSEYSFGQHTTLTGALTQADVLGIFGREGLDFANMWEVPKPTDPTAYSFRLYRNYDGHGGQFGDVGVSAASTDQSQLSVYAAERSSDNALTLVVINKTAGAINSSLALGGFTPTGTAQAFTYSNSNLTQIVPAGSVSVLANGFNYNFPSYSATVIAIPGHR